MKKFIIVLCLVGIIPGETLTQIVSNNFYSIGASGGIALMLAKEAIENFPETKFSSGVAFNVNALYHFSPKMSNSGFNLGVYIGHHSMGLTEQNKSFGTLNITPIMILLGFGRYEFGQGESYLLGELGIGIAFTDFDNGTYINDFKRSYKVNVKVETQNSFVFDLYGEVGLYLTNSISIFAGGQMVLQNVGCNWKMSGYSQTVPIADINNFYASSTQILIGMRFWVFEEGGF